MRKPEIRPSSDVTCATAAGRGDCTPAERDPVVVYLHVLDYRGSARRRRGSSSELEERMRPPFQPAVLRIPLPPLPAPAVRTCVQREVTAAAGQAVRAENGEGRV